MNAWGRSLFQPCGANAMGSGHSLRGRNAALRAQYRRSGRYPHHALTFRSRFGQRNNTILRYPLPPRGGTSRGVLS